MAEIVNLRRVRKSRARIAKEKEAADNRVAYGTPKELKSLNAARRDKAARDVDAHKRDDGDAED
jgi:hypothetical protein